MKNFNQMLALFGAICFSMGIYAQDETEFVRKTLVPELPACIYLPGEYSGQHSVIRSQDVIDRINNRSNPCSTINVNYSGFTPEAQTAFQFAVDIWEMSIESPQPITVSASFSDLGPGVLGAAGPVSFHTSNHPDATPGTFYPRALVEKIEDTQINPDPFGNSVDISASFSSTFNFYFGLDASPPPGQFDFVSVVLHELGHGLGFVGFGDVDTQSGVGSIRFSNTPSIYDRFIENGTSQTILSFADPSVALGDQLTGNDLFCTGAIATGQNGAIAPRIFVPGSWDSGSSYSHWNESTFVAGDVNSLMTPQIAPGEANHNPGPITLGFFEDMGWSICGGSLTVEKFTADAVEVSPNPFTSSIAIKLSNITNDDYTVNLFDINGRVVISETLTATNGNLTLSNLDKLGDALYFVKITNDFNGSSITKKVIKN